MTENNEKVKKLYVCLTYFHVLITVIKALKDKESEISILLAANWSSECLINDAPFIEKLEKSGLFQMIYRENYLEEKREEIRKIDFKWLKKIEYLRELKKICPINFKEYDELYLYNDIAPVGILLNQLKIKYNLLEDGTDCYKNNKVLIQQKWNLKKIIRYMFHFRELGSSKLIKSVEVNDKDGVFLKQKNLIEVPKKVLFNSLNEGDKKVISKIFLPHTDLAKFDGYSLLVTQPLCNANMLNSEQELLAIYDTLIETYLPKEKVVIKVHPRELTDYTKLKHKCEIIKDNFPLELCTFFENLKFNKVVTVTSTAINVIDNCEEKIFLGWEWLEKEREKIRNEAKQ